MKLRHRFACWSTVVVLLLGNGSVQAFIGDDKIAVASEYGGPIAVESTPAIETYSYHKNGYRIDVTFESGKSAVEAFHKLVGDKAFSAEQIQEFLKGYSQKQEWRPVETKAGEQRWHCGSVTASYPSEGGSPCLTFTSDYYLSGKPVPARDGPGSFPGTEPKTIATIEGNGNKTSDPFTISAQHGFSIRYEIAEGSLSWGLFRSGETQPVTQVNALSEQKGLVPVTAGPGEYHINVVANGPYRILVLQ